MQMAGRCELAKDVTRILLWLLFSGVDITGSEE
jgi:hypothetical protein